MKKTRVAVYRRVPRDQKSYAGLIGAAERRINSESSMLYAGSYIDQDGCRGAFKRLMEAASMGFSMEDFAPLYMTSQIAGIFDVFFSTSNSVENDDLFSLLRVPMLLKSPEVVVEALYWIDDIIERAEEGENKSLLISKAYDAEKLRLPPALEALPKEPNRNVDDLAYAYWLGYIYRCESLMHEESSRMVYGAFTEEIMRQAYRNLLVKPMGELDLVESAIDICEVLDRFLVEKLWPEKKKEEKKKQEKECERREGGN